MTRRRNSWGDTERPSGMTRNQLLLPFWGTKQSSSHVSDLRLAPYTYEVVPVYNHLTWRLQESVMARGRSNLKNINQRPVPCMQTCRQTSHDPKHVML